jgi:hypothetical protein
MCMYDYMCPKWQRFDTSKELGSIFFLQTAVMKFEKLADTRFYLMVARGCTARAEFQSPSAAFPLPHVRGVRTWWFPICMSG